MRLFIGLWPAPEVADVLDRLSRPEHPDVRWTARTHWHVTLRFLGEVEDDDEPALVEALEVAGSWPARLAALGPATARLGRHNIVVPVHGVDDLGAAAADATRAFGPPREERPFTGHLTVARGRSGRPVPPELTGQEVEAAWSVAELALVRSDLSSKGARYSTISTVTLAPDPTRAAP